MIKMDENSAFFALELIPGKASEMVKDLFEEQQAFIPVSDSLMDFAYTKDNVAEYNVILFGRRLNRPAKFPLVWHDNIEIRCEIDLAKWIKIMHQESYRPEHSIPITARLPFHYHKLPGVIRNFLAYVLLNLKKVREDSVFPILPLNRGCEILLTACGVSEKKRSAPILALTHDIDTKPGFPWISRIAKIEEMYGFRSSWNLVPKSYDIDRPILHELKSKGHEIGLHGIWHNNQEAFLPKDRLHYELSTVQPLINEFEIMGYRGPSWYRTRSMFDVLERFFEYDTTCLDNDFVCPGGRGGVGMIRPFRIRDELVEIPCTLPFEAPLFFGHSSNSILQYWLPKIKWIKNTGGILVVNTHPDPNYLGNERMLKVYESFLAYLVKEDWKWMLPREIIKYVT